MWLYRTRFVLTPPLPYQSYQVIRHRTVIQASDRIWCIAQKQQSVMLSGVDTAVSKFGDNTNAAARAAAAACTSRVCTRAHGPSPRRRFEKLGFRLHEPPGNKVCGRKLRQTTRVQGCHAKAATRRFDDIQAVWRLRRSSTKATSRHLADSL